MGLNRNLGNIPEVIKESGGKIGIGSSNPNTLLEVASTTSNAARIRVNNTSTTAGQYRGYEFASGTTFKGGFLQDQNTDLISIFTPIGGQSVNINTNGNVGIGNVNPLAKLVVSTASNVNFEVRNGADYGLTGVGIDSRDDTRSTRNAMFIYGSPIVLGGGNVLINTTTNSGYRLDVNGLARIQAGLTLGDYDGLNLKFKAATSTGSTYLRFYNSADTARGYLGLFWNGTSDYMVCDAGPLEMNFASSNKFTFNGSNVGINESNPISKLHVTGTMRTALVSGAGGDTLISAIIGVSNGYLINVDTGNNITHTWHTGTNNPSMRITSGGNVLIGSTSDNGNKFQVNGSITATNIDAGQYVHKDSSGVSFITYYNNLPNNSSKSFLLYNAPDSPTVGGMWTVTMVKWFSDYGSMMAINCEPNTQNMYVKTVYGGSWSGWVQK